MSSETPSPDGLTPLQRCVQDYNRRTAFHDMPRLKAVIQAAREEEQAKFAALIEAARAVLATVESGP